MPTHGGAAAPTVGAAPVEVAVLNRHGVIVRVNEAWRAFARANGGDPSRTGVGCSYLAVCDADADDPGAVRVAAAVRQAVSGSLVLPEHVLIPCHGPLAERWFAVTVASRFDAQGRCTGAVVTLTEAPGPPPGHDGALPPGESAAVLDALPDGVAVVAPDGRLIQVNAQLERLSGLSRDDLVGRAVEVLVPPGQRREHRSSRAGYDTEPHRRLMGQGRPLGLHRADGIDVPVEISLGPSVVAGRRVTVAVVRDLRPRLALESRLRLVGDLLDVIDDALVVVDGQTRTWVYANRSAREHADGEPDPPAGAPFRIAGAPVDAEDLEEAFRAVQGGSTHQVSVRALATRADGTRHPVELTLTGRPPGPGQPRHGYVVVQVRDVTDRERLTLLEERQRIARDLHDTVLQDLYAIGLQVQTDAERQRNAGTGPPDDGSVDALLDRLDHTARRLRSLVFEIGPPPLRESLTEKVDALVANAARALGFLPSLDLAGDVDSLSDALGLDVVAVLQEALSNVARHAGAGHCRVSVRVGGGKVRVGVEDDGTGPARDGAAGIGLDNIRHRAVARGGGTKLSRLQPHGTRLSWTVPLAP